MTAAAQALLVELEQRGIRIRVAGPGDLRVSPPEEIDQDLLGRLRAAKPELLAALTSCWPCSRCGRFAFGRPAVVCYWCASTPEAHA